MTTAWVLPTARATSWLPLAVVGVVVLVAGSVFRLADAAPSGLLKVAAAVAAAGVAAGLRDRAHALLAAVPTSPARRRAYRLALLVPAMLLGWVALIALARATGGDWQGGWSLGPLAALTSTAVAASVWAPDRWQVTAGVTAPVLWLAVQRSLATDTGLLHDLASAWYAHPWSVTAVAVAATALGRNR